MSDETDSDSGAPDLSSDEQQLSAEQEQEQGDATMQDELERTESEIDYFAVENEADNEESEEEEEEDMDVDLEMLSKETHPCLVKGNFSIFNSPNVGLASSTQDVTYTLDMDGFLVVSRYLSTFLLCKYGEARVWSKSTVENLHTRIKKSKLFATLPENLCNFETWLPGFRLVDGPAAKVWVIFRPKSSATADDVSEWQTNCQNLPRVWWNCVLIPAVKSLPDSSRTRRFNAVHTFEVTQVFPTYMRIYREDLEAIDQALDDAPQQLSDFHWFFLCSSYGQRRELREDEQLGPSAFGLGDVFDLTSALRVSIHLAMNFKCTDDRFSLFWGYDRTFDWMQSRTNSKNRYPLFGLRELANFTVYWPKIPALDAAFEGHGHAVVFAQCYTPTVKGMENRVPLSARPNLLTYLLGEAYISQSARFRQIWEEVRTQRTLHEILEVVSPTTALDARLEVVVNDVDASFLASFRHRHLARTVVKRGLLVKVPACDFAGYVGAMVKELYGPLEAAVQGTLTGPGTLGTVLLCESLLSYLPSGCVKEQPIRLLQAYDILPLARLKQTRKVDLRRFATTRNGVLYIRRPALQRIWIPRSSLPPGTCATVYSMISFLDKLKAGRNTVEATTRAAGIIVGQFKRDLKEMGVVQDFQLFNGVVLHGSIRDAQTADEYVSRVFVPDHMPSTMATKGFLSTALDLFDRTELNRKIIESLQHVAVVPYATVHARAVCFSSTFCTVIIRGPVSAATVSPSDAHRLVIAATQLLRDNFSLSKKDMKKVQKCRPRLTGCVVEAVRKARSRTGSLRYILRVVAYATMYLADKEELLSRKPDYQSLYRSCNLNRYILKREMKDIVTALLAVEERSLEDAGGRRRQIALRAIPGCSVVLDRIIAPTRRH